MEHRQLNHHHSGHKHGALIAQLLDCAEACETCASSCLDEIDVTPMAHCIEIDRDCADICILAAKLLARDSEFVHELLSVSEKACNHCADECNKHEHMHCKRCAEMAEMCAQACHMHGENRN